MEKVFNEIYDYVKGLEIIDTHEHLPPFEEAREKDTDVLKEYLTHYFNRDLVSAGLKINDYYKAIDNKIPLMERWTLVEPYWEAARHTGYGRALDISACGLYGIDKICRSTLEELNEQFLNSLKPGHFDIVLKEKSKIKVSLLDNGLGCDNRFFLNVYRLDSFIYPTNMTEVRQIETDSGIRICSMEDWLEACEIVLDKLFRSGVVALKSGLAYRRTLRYERVTKNEAEGSFNQIFKAKSIPDWDNQSFSTGKEFQDYMMHFVLRLANKRNMAFQFHTGLQEGNGNDIYNSDPALLTNLILEYPDIDFDIFHIGYPFQNVLSAMAKTFPNVYIDMAWAHIISPSLCVNSLIEWIDTVPYNKISAFGGDYLFIDGVYGHQYMARINISKALTKKVEERIFDIEKSKEIAEMLFYKNPLKIFKLGDKLK